LSLKKYDLCGHSLGAAEFILINKVLSIIKADGPDNNEGLTLRDKIGVDNAMEAMVSHFLPVV
jgi:hypothetical protein